MHCFQCNTITKICITLKCNTFETVMFHLCLTRPFNSRLANKICITFKCKTYFEKNEKSKSESSHHDSRPANKICIASSATLQLRYASLSSFKFQVSSFKFRVLPAGMSRPRRSMGKLFPYPVGKAHIKCPSSSLCSALHNMSTCKTTNCDTRTSSMSLKQPGNL